MIYQETRSIRFAPPLETIYNTLNEFARRGLPRDIALYDAKVWYDTKTGTHFHFYFEDTDELCDIPDHQLPDIEITPPEGKRVAAVDVIVRPKKA
jgi:Fur family transcriptional regulator, iron response regulator